MTLKELWRAYAMGALMGLGVVWIVVALVVEFV